LLFASLSLNVSAAGDNLIDSNLSNWNNLDGSDNINVYSNGDIYRLSSSGGSDNLFIGMVYDAPSFIAGHSYTLRFKIPSSSEIGSAWGVNWTDELSKGYYNNSTVFVGYGFLAPDGSSIETQVVLYEFNSANISKYLGKSLTTTFVAGSSTGRPVVYIGINSNDANTHHFYFSNFVLFDNDDNSKELTGIKGFLHSIRWDLIGGVCEENDCPHSNAANPHLSLTERMTSGFASLLDNIGNKFEDGSTLSSWFHNLSSSVTNLGDRINGFFSGLGDRISGFFDKLKQDMTSGFTNVGEWFSGLGDNLSKWFDGVKLKFQEVGDSIKNKFQEIADKFTEFFEKFKPRVFIDLNWKRGIINWGTGVVDFKNDNYPYVIVSDFFLVETGTTYLLDYKDSDITNSIAIYKYDIFGNYLGADAQLNSLEGYKLESGFQYRFRTEYTPGVKDLSVVNDYVMIYADEGWINAMIHKLKITVTGLFVPDESSIDKMKNDFDTLLESHLGIVYSGTNVIKDLIITAFNMINNSNDSYYLLVPGVTLPLGGKEYSLWDDTQIDFSFMEIEVIQTIYGIYTIALYIFFGSLELKYAARVYRKVINN